MRRGGGCHLPWGCSRAALGSAHQPALISLGDRGLLWALSTRAHWWPGDPHLVLADPSESRPLSLNHIPWACSL